MARRKLYSAEFKRQALKRADEPGITDALVCEELGISTRQLQRWRNAVKVHSDAYASPGHSKSRDKELTRLRHEPAKIKVERDYLETVARYFIALLDGCCGNIRKVFQWRQCNYINNNSNFTEGLP